MATRRTNRKRPYTTANPWSQRWMDLSAKDPRPEQQLARIEAQQADAMGTRTCDCCGATAYYRPGVGAFQCPNCRALFVRGEWVK